mgnify:CR=1 FL=1
MQQVSKIEKLPLPGVRSHVLMTPEVRKQELLNYDYKQNNPKLAAVLSLFYPDVDFNTELLLILRKTYKGVHSNQIAFPGGKPEPEDGSILQTALRETEEEVGVKPHQIKVLKQMTPVYIPPSNFEVHPFIGVANEPLTFVRQLSEVEAIVRVKLTDFMNDDLIFEQELSTSYAKNIKVPAFQLNGYVVWGATAMMLNEIKTLLNEVL